MYIHGFDAHRATAHTRLGEISYVDVGEGPAAVLVHGVGTNAYLWRNVIEGLGTDGRHVALDLPLHGRSPAPAHDLTLNGMADAVLALCDALELAQFDLVGNDMGGAVAQIVAARDPGRLRSLTLTNCDTHDNLPPEAFLPTVELARAGALAPTAPALLDDLTAARTAVFAMGYEDPESLTTEMVDAFLRPVMGTPDTALRFEQLLASIQPADLLDIEPALAELTVPTLVVWGTGDSFFDLRWAYWLRDTIPGVTEVVEVDGARLFFVDERADDLVPHLRRHWAAAREVPLSS